MAVPEIHRRPFGYAPGGFILAVSRVFFVQTFSGYAPYFLAVSNMATTFSPLHPGWTELDEERIYPPPGAALRMVSFTVSATSSLVPKGSR